MVGKFNSVFQRGPSPKVNSNAKKGAHAIVYPLEIISFRDVTAFCRVSYTNEHIVIMGQIVSKECLT